VASGIVITTRAYWIGRWFVHPLARAFVLIDRVEHPGEWSIATRIALDLGPHAVAVGIRYRWGRALLGVREVPVEVEAGRYAHLCATNGLINSEPFYVTRSVNRPTTVTTIWGQGQPRSLRARMRIPLRRCPGGPDGRSCVR